MWKTRKNGSTIGWWSGIIQAPPLVFTSSPRLCLLFPPLAFTPNHCRIPIVSPHTDRGHCLNFVERKERGCEIFEIGRKQKYTKRLTQTCPSPSPFASKTLLPLIAVSCQLMLLRERKAGYEIWFFGEKDTMINSLPLRPKNHPDASWSPAICRLKPLRSPAVFICRKKGMSVVVVILILRLGWIEKQIHDNQLTWSRLTPRLHLLFLPIERREWVWRY